MSNPVKKVSILMYHQIGEFANIKQLKANFCHIKDFKNHMAFLSLCGYHVIPMSKVVDFLKGQYLTDESHVVAITFDDGYENLHQHALPILAAQGFSAMVYLVADEIGGKAKWLAQKNIEPYPLLNSHQIQEMVAQGIEFGSHSVSHPRLSQLPRNQALTELTTSKQRLEDTFSMPFEHFCYPFGDHKVETIQLAREAGYKSATTTIKGSAKGAHDAMALPRKAISFGRGRYRLWRDLRFKDGQLSDSIVLLPIVSA